MNRSLKNLLLLPILLIGLNLSAQLHYTVVPANESQVTSAIVQDFGHLMDISSGQLNTHISGLIDPNAYCASCPGTGLAIQSSGQNTLQLHWPAIANAQNYDIRYLNLENGTTGNYLVSSPSITINNLPNAAYAFSIGVNSLDSNNDLQASQRDIVILETPVVVFPLGYDYNCDCNEDISMSLAIEASIITWFPELHERYRFNLLFTDGTNTEVILYATDSDEPDYPLAYSLHCAEFLYHSDGSNTLLSEGEASDFSIHFDYVEDQHKIEFFSELNPLLTATLTHCHKDLPSTKLANESAAPNPYRLYPNPAEDGIWLSSHSKINDNTTLSIFNQLGQLIKSEKLFETNQFIPINELATGRYSLQIKSEVRTETLQFIKKN